MKKRSILLAFVGACIGCAILATFMIWLTRSDSYRGGFRSVLVERLALVCDFFGADSKASDLRYEAHRIAYDLIQVEIPYVGEEEGNKLRDDIRQAEPRVLRWGQDFECQWSGGVESGVYKFNVPRDEEVDFRSKIRSMNVK